MTQSKQSASSEERESNDCAQDIHRNEQRFLALHEALGDLVLRRDDNGRIFYANRVFCDLMDCEPKEVHGRHLEEFGIDTAALPKTVFIDGGALDARDVSITAKGEVHWFSWTELALPEDSGEQQTRWSIAREITKRKRTETALTNARERAEQASVAKSRFLATVSHEIRTPMNGIMGMARLLSDTRLSPEQRTYVGAISTSASALLALIEDLLDYSKIEAGRLELEPQSISVRELVESIVELMASRAFSKNIGLGCHIAPDVPETITADPGRLRQILLNLLGNAVKFTEEGGVLVTVSKGRQKGEPVLSIKVEDTGPGLDEQTVARIFHEFEQGDDSSTRKHGGAGLGLAISRRLIAAMAGTISVESEPGEGAAFSVSIPVGEAEQAAHPEKALKSWDVAIVTPHVIEGEALAMAIRAHGGKAQIFDSEKSALSLLRQRNNGLDAILVDASLENEQGELLGKLRRQTAARQALTLIAPTDRGRLDGFRANGYDAFLARPVRGRTLLRMLLSGRPSSPHRAESDSRSMERAKEGSGLRVLIAEDNEINAMLARAALRKAGYSVTTVSNGRAAVDALTHPDREYDIALMDLHMPVLDGLDAIANIRRHEEETGLAPIPIVVLSADGQEKTRHSVLAHGANGFVTKPLDPDQLLSALESHAMA